MSDKLLKVEELAERSGLSASYFYTNRSLKKISLPFLKIGSSIRVRESEFEAWLNSHSQNSGGMK